MGKKARKPGLLCRSLSIELESVTHRMRQVCAVCGCHPGHCRVILTQGNGRWAKRAVLCAQHGAEEVRRFTTKAGIAGGYLQTMVDEGHTEPIPDVRYRPGKTPESKPKPKGKMVAKYKVKRA